MSIASFEFGEQNLFMNFLQIFATCLPPCVAFCVIALFFELAWLDNKRVTNLQAWKRIAK